MSQFQSHQFDEELPRYKNNLDTRPIMDLSFRVLIAKALLYLRQIYSETLNS